MLLTEHQISLLQAPFTSIWLGCGTSDKKADIIRLSGMLVAEDKIHLDVFVPQRFTPAFLMHIQENPKVTFLGSSILTFETLQIKGTYLNHRTSSPAEVSYQKEYLQGFSQAVTSVGVKAGNGFNHYLSEPCMTIRMKAEEIYNQTPKAGAGNKIS